MCSVCRAPIDRHRPTHPFRHHSADRRSACLMTSPSAASRIRTLGTMPVDRDRYRQLAGAFPTGVTIVTTCDPEGAPWGLTTQCFGGLAADPPMMLVAIDKSSRTLRSLQQSRGFVINFLKT